MDEGDVRVAYLTFKVKVHTPMRVRLAFNTEPRKPLRRSLLELPSLRARRLASLFTSTTTSTHPSPLLKQTIIEAAHDSRKTVTIQTVHKRFL
jgi:hypothetical protein